MSDVITNTYQNTNEKRIFYATKPNDWFISIKEPKGPQMGISWSGKKLNGWHLLKDSFGKWYVIKNGQKVELFDYQALALINVMYTETKLEDIITEAKLEFMGGAPGG